MIFMFIYFIVVSSILLPFAYITSLVYKVQKIFKSTTTYEYAITIFVAIMFTITGPPTVCLTFLVDCYYFWKNNFKKE